MNYIDVPNKERNWEVKEMVGSVILNIEYVTE